MNYLKVMLATAMVVAPHVAMADMRCGKHLVLEGYNFDKVSQLCGDADATYAMGERHIYQSVRDGSQEAAIAEVVRLDMWVYRGGENDFTRNLHFENGILVKIELGGRQ